MTTALGCCASPVITHFGPKSTQYQDDTQS